MAANTRWSNQQSNCPAPFGRQLQRAKRSRLQFVRPAQDGPDALATKRLAQCPQLISLRLGTNKDGVRHFDAMAGQSRGINPSVPVDYNERAAVTAGFPCGNERKSDGAAAAVGKVFDQRPAAKTARKQGIDATGKRGTGNTAPIE